ncbi:hypothetical protein [Streptomyces synnematoformans]
MLPVPPDVPVVLVPDVDPPENVVVPAPEVAPTVDPAFRPGST